VVCWLEGATGSHYEAEESAAELVVKIVIMQIVSMSVKGVKIQARIDCSLVVNRHGGSRQRLLEEAQRRSGRRTSRKSWSGRLAFAAR
jgi:hypothetical protein